ncbi:hypothetical protein FGG78_20875 [Thioclava sp. BHET1]|nr:hypothetical protein FGG78_20875 [Thioclava sp. BHET1]
MPGRPSIFSRNFQMNLQLHMMTIPRMPGGYLATRLALPADTVRGRPAPGAGKGKTARHAVALRRSGLGGGTLGQILPGTGSAGAEALVPDREPTAIFVERMLADPMIRLVMLADGVSEREIRTLYWTRAPKMIHRRGSAQASELSAQVGAIPEPGPRPGSPRPGIGE